jgi:hypothetical protein
MGDVVGMLFSPTTNQRSPLHSGAFQLLCMSLPHGDRRVFCRRLTRGLRFVLRLPLRSSNWNRGPWARVRVLALLQFLVLSLGVPLPSPANSASDRSGERYPCQGSACGCSTAAKCWTACCCMTNQQKLLWARENGITPPSYVLEAANREQAIADELAQQRAASGRRPCCQKTLQRSSAASVAVVPPMTESTVALTSSQSPAPRSCCEAKSSTVRKCCDRVARTSPASSGFTWVLMIQAQRCQGESGGLFAICAVAPPPAIVVSPLEFAPGASIRPAALHLPLVPALLPALPPPRVG